MTEYIIVPNQRITTAHTWRFIDLDLAQAAARQLSIQNNTSVLVAQILGEYCIDSLWIASDGGNEGK